MPFNKSRRGGAPVMISLTTLIFAFWFIFLAALIFFLAAGL